MVVDGTLMEIVTLMCYKKKDTNLFLTITLHFITFYRVYLTTSGLCFRQ